MLLGNRLDYAGENRHTIFAENVGEVAVNGEIVIDILPNLFLMTGTRIHCFVHIFHRYSRTLDALAGNFEFGDVTDFVAIDIFVGEVGEVTAAACEKLVDAHLLDFVFDVIIK